MADPDPEALAASREFSKGFSSIAKCFASDTDNETLIFRKFDELGIQNLLYLQCEMMELEARLKDLNRGFAKDPELSRVLGWWEKLVQEVAMGQDCRPEVRQRMDLIYDLRRATKEYRKSNMTSRDGSEK